ncbi:MAG: DoxX family protein [Candidatus Dormibacteraceae bacterium]
MTETTAYRWERRALWRRFAASPFRALAYWVPTLLLAAELLGGGMTDTLHLPPFYAALVQLGYPGYVGVIIGVWKVLGAITVLAPRLPRLKEWAYAGAVFDLTGAAASYLAVGGSAGDLAAPLAFVGLAAASWALRPTSRRLGPRVGGRAAAQ